MFDLPRWKIWGIFLAIALGIAFAIPSFFPKSQVATWPSFVPRTQIALGLDLAGGSQLLLEADLADAEKQRLAAMEDSVSQELRRAPRIQAGDISTSGGRVSFILRDPTQLDAAVERLRTLTAGVGLTGTRTWNVSTADGNRVIMTPTPEGAQQAVKDAMTVARDVVRRRIDPSGTREVTVINQGANRILVQVPGVDDPEALKRLIGQTARLEFKLVDLRADQNQVAQGRAPAGSQVLPMADGTGAIAVQRRAMVSGENVSQATQAFDQQTGAPVVTIRFDTAGARRFGRATTENVNKPFAIILDNKVLSAPNINEPILGGTAQISGNFTVETASELAVALSSGKLPVKLDVIEERTVSAELGRDSIEKGLLASAAAVLAVMIFMILTYGRFGVYANLALLVNAFMILAIMGIFGSALTLPGIAGFVLTIGAAVDANVLINERIREEQKRGRKLLDAIDTGYKEASTAIFDANITNTIAAALMWYFGSGPVRGFAIVLLIGIITSVFTAVNFTRLLVALWVRAKRPRELHI
ncbi:preprotein translocase subunit SecD [Sphingomonas kaistensis]|uniref:Protein translocase subunit SecD n=1 Tax=Sphingomonas kaistensis TaxID=298708 RepID=A0A7X5Y3F5_9SPHN|nr:protein translocase subunit SecD [Sphingomonas kaistensis]NJC04456.1 preprotein translocase subunit SecD [Sphingomonas kaistensis]